MRHHFTILIFDARNHKGKNFSVVMSHLGDHSLTLFGKYFRLAEYSFAADFIMILPVVFTGIMLLFMSTKRTKYT